MCGSFDDIAKVLLIVLNVLVLLLSIALIGVGIWALTSDYGANELASLISTELYTAGCVIIIIAGVILLLLAVFGALGGFLESKVILLVYFYFMFIFLVTLIIGIIVGFFYIDEIEDKLADNMEETLRTQYGANLTTNSDNEAVTEVWNNFQKDLKCCGVRGSLNSSESWFLWQSSLWFEYEGKIGSLISSWWFVPSSCCNTDYTFPTCQEHNSGNSQPPKQTLNEVVDENPALYHDGCLDKLKDQIKEHIVAIAVTGSLLLVVMIVCLIVAMYLICVGGQRLQVV